MSIEGYFLFPSFAKVYIRMNCHLYVEKRIPSNILLEKATGSSLLIYTYIYFFLTTVTITTTTTTTMFSFSFIL